MRGRRGGGGMRGRKEIASLPVSPLTPSSFSTRQPPPLPYALIPLSPFLPQYKWSEKQSVTTFTTEANSSEGWPKYPTTSAIHPGGRGSI